MRASTQVKSWSPECPGLQRLECHWAIRVSVLDASPAQHCAGQSTSSEHEGTALLSTDKKTLSAELDLWDILVTAQEAK